MQSMKENGFDQEDGTKVNQVAKALAAINVNLMDSNGQFRNFGTVMDESVLNGRILDSRQKAYVATTVAGTYQQSRFMKLMEGYKDSTNLYAKSLDSAGTASKKFQLYQQGTQAQIEKLKAQWDGLWMATFNSEAVRLFIASFATSLLLLKQ
jgi:TP901 family phage tail tape measure protein